MDVPLASLSLSLSSAVADAQADRPADLESDQETACSRSKWLCPAISPTRDMREEAEAKAEADDGEQLHFLRASISDERFFRCGQLEREGGREGGWEGSISGMSAKETDRVEDGMGRGRGEDIVF